MNNDELTYEMTKNTLLQITADMEKRPSIDVAMQYNYIVANTNALHDAGIYESPWEPDDAYQAINAILLGWGWSDVRALFVTLSEDWEAGWPVPVYTP